MFHNESTILSKSHAASRCYKHNEHLFEQTGGDATQGIHVGLLTIKTQFVYTYVLLRIDISVYYLGKYMQGNQTQNHCEYTRAYLEYVYVCI